MRPSILRPLKRALRLGAAAALLGGAILAAAAPASAQTASSGRMVLADVGFVNSEAARYDPVADHYLVTNLGPRGEGNDGFISRVSPDGAIRALKWIEGGRDGTPLHEPLGLVIHGDEIFVADRDGETGQGAVRVFDRASGAYRRSIAVPDAVRLNDLAAAPDGTLYVTDSGSQTDEGALYVISPAGEVGVFVARGPETQRANGVAVTPDGLIVHGGLTGRTLFFRDARGAIVRRQDLPTGRIDGIVALDDGALLVASQEGHVVYLAAAVGGPVRAVAQDIPVPAAIGFDTRRSRLLTPQIVASTLTITEVAPD